MVMSLQTDLTEFPATNKRLKHMSSNWSTTPVYTCTFHLVLTQGLTQVGSVIHRVGHVQSGGSIRYLFVAGVRMRPFTSR